MSGTAVDLTGTELGEYRVGEKAPARARIRYWSVQHLPCGESFDVAQTMIQSVAKGKGTMPPCGKCRADEARPVQGISHGLHYACGRTHPLGEPCDFVHTAGTLTTEEIGDRIYGPRKPHPVTTFFPDGGMVMHPALELLDLGEDEVPAGEECCEALASVDLADFGNDFPCCASLELGDLGEEEPDGLPRSVFPAKAGEATRAICEEPDLDAAHGSLREMLLSTIEAGIDRLDERGRQDRIGPSEVGGCRRCLAARVAWGAAASNRSVAWRPYVGTCVHEGLDRIFSAEAGFLSDLKAAGPVPGSLDLYHPRLGAVVDWKVVGPTSMKKAAKGAISDRYRVQVHLYALDVQETYGWAPKTVAVMFLPSAGELRDAVLWSEPYDRTLALEAVAGLDALRKELEPLDEDGKRAYVEAIPPDPECFDCRRSGRIAGKPTAPALTLEGAA